MKRSDLQGIRGLAIVSVLLFHFFPARFPNGYVGVDQFFVLSGFLMTLIFGSKPITTKSIRQFYYRRVKRILPLYAAVISMVYILMFFVLPSTFRDLNKDTAIRAALLISNLPKPASENDYFVQLEQASDLFTHSWSLSVEMQFYLLVPLLFSLFSLTWTVSCLSFLVISLSSLGYHLLADSHTSFNNVACRIWQFQIGMAAFYIGQWLSHKMNKNGGSGSKEPILGEESDQQKLNNSRKSHANKWIFRLSLHCLLFCSFWPMKLETKVIRPVSTILTGFLIAFGGLVDHNHLSEKHLVYCGDISYSLYLLHWPLYIWVKYYYKDDVCIYLLTIVVALFLSILTTETFEKWYQTLKGRSAGLLLLFLYGLLAIAVLQSKKLSKFADGEDVDLTGILNRNISAEEAIRINREFDRLEYPNLIIPNCMPNKTEHGFCSFEAGHGENRILVLGNSYAANMAQLVNQAFHPIAKNISKYSKSYCEVLVVDTENPQCSKSFYRYLNIAQTYQPDILFILSRTMKAEATPVVGQDDALIQEMKRTITEYEKVTKKRIYVLNSIPRVKSDHIRKLNSFIKSNTTETGDFGVRQTYQFGQQRINEAVKICKKCHVFNFNSRLVGKNGTVNFFDPIRKLSYYTSGVHLTAAGLELVRPIFQELAANYTDFYPRLCHQTSASRCNYPRAPFLATFSIVLQFTVKQKADTLTEALASFTSQFTSDRNSRFTVDPSHIDSEMIIDYSAY